MRAQSRQAAMDGRARIVAVAGHQGCDDERGVQTTLTATLLAMLIFAVAACSGAAGTQPPAGSTAPSGGPSQPATIDHPTGATDVVLRFEEGGGFVPPGFLLTEAPTFTLYGTGMVIFRDPAAQPGPPAAGAWKLPRMKTATLTEGDVQALLRFALGPGGLAVARPHYDPGTVADAGTATFTIRASGMTKTVSVVALEIATPTGADGTVVRALLSLRDRLLATGRALGSPADWVPARYRAVLIDGGSTDTSPSIPWPWPTLTPADFRAPADPGRPSFPTHVLTADEARAIGLTGFEGGLEGVRVVAPSGTIYGLVLRPLLPDEAS